MTNERLPYGLQYVSTPRPNLYVPFWRCHGLRNNILLRDAFSKKEKEQLLDEDIQKLSLLFAEHGLSFPKDPYSRVRFLKLEKFYLAARRLGQDKKLAFSAGFALVGTSFGFVDVWSAGYTQEKHNFPKEISLRKNFIHELLHCLEDTELWVLVNGQRKNNYSRFKRMGFSTSKTVMETNKITMGGRRLNEGLAKYLENKIVNFDPGFKDVGYAAEVEVIKYLVEKIGLGPLLKAAYSKNGLRILNEKMTEIFGRKSLRGMLEWMELEFYKNDEKNKNRRVKEELKSYTKTLAYLRFNEFWQDMASNTEASS